MALVCALALALVGCGGGGGHDPLIGIQDDQLAEPSVPAAQRMEIVAGLEAEVVRVDLRWDRVAGAGRPADPRDHRSSEYDWRRYDAVAASAQERGVRVLFTIWGTPAWAADPSVPASADTDFGPWTTRPLRARDAGDFAFAAATRYSASGVTLWEVWNEPNIPLFLRPQYERQDGRWVATSPRTYARLAAAMYREIKRADPQAEVAVGVTAPAGDVGPSDCEAKGVGGEDCRIPPLKFLRELTADGRRPPMDAYSHHPYPLTIPRDVSQTNSSFIDLYNIERLEGALADAGLGEVPIWLSEFGFPTKSVGEYRLRVSEPDQATYLTDALRRVRANPRVELFIWYFLQDSENWASGLRRADGSEKPAADAFRDR